MLALVMLILFCAIRKEQLYNIAEMLNLMPPVTGDDSALDKHSKDFLLELLVTRHERRQSQLDYINELPLYPTEKVIWDENLVPNEYFSGESKSFFFQCAVSERLRCLTTFQVPSP